MTTRGERNNNPGNIDWNPKVNWQGQTGIESGPDARFATFSDPKFGIRAIARQLLSYQNQHDIHTVRGFISRWAPSSENNTDAYVKSVAAAMGVGPDDEIDVDSEAVMTPMVKAIITKENGANPYPDAMVADAIKMAGVSGARGAPLTAQKPFMAQVGAGAAVVTAGATQLSTYAPTVKGWADQLSDYTGSPIIQHVVTVLVTVAGGLTVMGIVFSVLNHRKAV